MLKVITQDGKVKGVPMGNAVVIYDGSGFAKTVITSGGGAGAVTSFNGRTGAVELNSNDVTTALGYTPASPTILVEAVQDVLAFLPITANGQIADSSNLAHRLKVIGISTAAALTGFNIVVQFQGLIINPTWSWTAGQKIYINNAGLSSASPSAGWSMSIGRAMGATKILIDLGQPFLL